MGLTSHSTNRPLALPNFKRSARVPCSPPSASTRRHGTRQCSTANVPWWGHIIGKRLPFHHETIEQINHELLAIRPIGVEVPIALLLASVHQELHGTLRFVLCDHPVGDDAEVEPVVLVDLLRAIEPSERLTASYAGDGELRETLEGDRLVTPRTGKPTQHNGTFLRR